MTAEGVVLLVTVILVIAVVALLLVRWLTARRLNALKGHFPNALRTEPALFYGHESQGKAQLRGNGVLVLLPDRLVFSMLVPVREYAIPRKRIIRTESPSSYLGKTNFRPLLKVVFQSENGQLDSMAWLVDDVPAWQAAIGGPSSAP